MPPISEIAVGPHRLDVKTVEHQMLSHTPMLTPSVHLTNGYDVSP